MKKTTEKKVATSPIKKRLDKHPYLPRVSKTGLDPKIQRFKKLVTEGYSFTEAYLDINPGVERTSAATMGCRLFNQLCQSGDIAKCLEQAGISDALIAQKIREGLDAMETKTATEKGQITDTIDMISWSERREYAKLALQLLGRLKNGSSIELPEGTTSGELTLKFTSINEKP